MTDDRSNDELCDSMMDALLQSAHETDTTQIEARLTSVMSQIEHERRTHATVLKSTLSQRTPYGRRRWISLAVAASVLIALIVVVQTTDSNRGALAAVQRSIAAAKEFVARQYRVTVTLRGSDQNPVEISSDLYVQGSDRFALRHPAVLPKASLWLGSDGREAWLVPALGPVRVGDQTGLGRWLNQQEQLSTPFLHVETILARMNRGYRLEQKPESTIELENGTAITCQHVTGTLKWKTNPKAPDRIDLWSESQSGIAIRLHADWNEPVGVVNHEKISIEFVDSPELPENWFSASGHSSRNRKILRFDSTE